MRTKGVASLVMGGSVCPKGQKGMIQGRGLLLEHVGQKAIPKRHNTKKRHDE